MNHISLDCVKLLPRNEGKIKSYESCDDIRTCSHDFDARDRYLREWMKTDMPLCVIPVSTPAGFLRAMSCRNRGQTMARCHPDCKSKVLESFRSSCHGIEECLKSDEDLEKFFFEEELELSHWPCERCLEALKSIKMFWKLIIEKIFNINVSKNKVFEDAQCCHSNSVREIAKLWPRDMVRQALLVKTVTPQLTHCPTISRNSCFCKQSKISKNESCSRFHTPSSWDSSGAILSHQTSRATINSSKCKNIPISNRNKASCKKNCYCAPARVKTMDCCCNTNISKCENDNITECQKKIEHLQHRLNGQNDEIETLKKDNIALRIELKNFYNSCKWKSGYSCPPPDICNKQSVTLIPKPFDSCIDNRCAKTSKDTDSEMIITMKKCKKESFKYVHFLQVLHKTKAPILTEVNLNGPCYKKENPIELLTKVQNTIGAMVNREMTLVGGKKCQIGKYDVEASFRRVTASKSAPSCPMF